MVKGINAYIVTNGNGQEAVKFYEEALDAQVISLQTFGDLPESPDFPIPSEAKNYVLHAHMKIGANELMLSDNFPGTPYTLGNQVGIAVIISTPEKTKTVFDSLSADGHIIMELQQTFWSPLYGQVKDKFGVTWQVSTISEAQ